MVRKTGYTERNMRSLTTLELCAGAGDQALGLEQVGIVHSGLIEIDQHACATLWRNRPDWNIIEDDLNHISDLTAFKGVDIVSGGSPGPPFSRAGGQLGIRLRPWRGFLVFHYVADVGNAGPDKGQGREVIEAAGRRGHPDRSPADGCVTCAGGSAESEQITRVPAPSLRKLTVAVSALRRKA